MILVLSYNQVVQLTLEFKELKSKWGSFALGGKMCWFFSFSSLWAFLELSSSSLLTFESLLIK